VLNTESTGIRKKTRKKRFRNVVRYGGGRKANSGVGVSWAKGGNAEQKSCESRAQTKPQRVKHGKSDGKKRGKKVTGRKTALTLKNTSVGYQKSRVKTRVLGGGAKTNAHKPKNQKQKKKRLKRKKKKKTNLPKERFRFVCAKNLKNQTRSASRGEELIKRGEVRYCPGHINAEKQSLLSPRSITESTLGHFKQRWGTVVWCEEADAKRLKRAMLTVRHGPVIPRGRGTKSPHEIVKPRPESWEIKKKNGLFPLNFGFAFVKKMGVPIERKNAHKRGEGEEEGGSEPR